MSAQIKPVGPQDTTLRIEKRKDLLETKVSVAAESLPLGETFDGPRIPRDEQSTHEDGPSSIGGYRIHSVLGEGGMALVYRAIDPESGEHVAIKVMQTHQAFKESGRIRFEREARLGQRLDHPNVVGIRKVGNDRGIPFIVMDLVEGECLATLLARKRTLSARRVAKLARILADALAYTHRQGLIHRDLKPSNIFLTQKGRPLIGDFGLCKPLDEIAQDRVTQTGALLGTLAYMAPEQALCQSTDQRTDIYALGAILYELLTGDLPVEGDTPIHTLQIIPTQAPRPMGQLRAGIPQQLEAIVFRCLAKDPAERYASADDLGAELDAFLSSKEAVRLTRPTGQTDPCIKIAKGLIKVCTPRKVKPARVKHETQELCPDQLAQSSRVMVSAPQPSVWFAIGPLLAAMILTVAALVLADAKPPQGPRTQEPSSPATATLLPR